MPHLRLAAAQLNTVVGDLPGNVERVLTALAAAEAAGADICVVPELAIPGYPPEDLLLKPGFVADNVTALEKVAAATGHCAVVVGFVGAAPGGVGLANAAAVCAGGRVLGVYRKRFLPNYGVFDEQRWFVPSDEPPALFGVAGAWVGVSICEDVWFDDGPVAQAGRGGADVVVNLNASPYNRGRRAERLGMLSGRVAEAGCAIAYVNQVGGQDELVFDGDSLVVASDGTLVGSGVQFAEDLVVVDLPIGSHPPRAVSRAPAPHRGDRASAGRPSTAPAATPRPPLSDDAEVYEALVLGTPRLSRARTGSPKPSSGCRAGSTRRWWRPSPSMRSGRRGARHLHAVALFERGLPRRRRRAGRAAGHRPQDGRHRGGPRGVLLHAGAAARARALRVDRREPPIAPARACS